MLAALCARAGAPIGMAGIAFTHGLDRSCSATIVPLIRWPRGLALALLDALPPAKRAFTRAMLFGVR